MPPFGPQKPVRANILDSAAGASVYSSGIIHNRSKFAQMPPNWEECEGTVEEDTADGGLVITRHFIGPWSSREAFRLWARGYTMRGNGLGSIFEGGVATVLSRIPPCQDPVVPHLYCTSCRMVETMGAVVMDPSNFPVLGFGVVPDPLVPLPTVAYVNNSEGGSFVLGGDEDDLANPNVPTGNFLDGRCKFRCEFRSFPFEIRSDAEVAALPVPEMGRWLERQYLPSIEALPMNKLNAAGGPLALQFNDPDAGDLNDKEIPEAGTLLLPTMQVSLIWYSVPDPPFQVMMNLMGKVNLSVFDGPAGAGVAGYIQFDPETLLFMQPKWRRKPRDSKGSVLFDIALNFLARPKTGWNKFPSPKGNEFYTATFGGSKGAGEKLYKAGNFNDVFAPTPVVRW
jgi:hypothetical protein